MKKKPRPYEVIGKGTKQPPNPPPPPRGRATPPDPPATLGNEYKNLLSTARALLARAETAERANEAYSSQIQAMRTTLQELIDALNALETYTADGVPAVEVVKRLGAARAAAVSVLKGDQ